MSIYIEINEKDMDMVNVFTKRRDGTALLWAVMQADTLIELGIKKQDLENAGEIELAIKGN
jgi:hypothetical protein